VEFIQKVNGKRCDVVEVEDAMLTPATLSFHLLAEVAVVQAEVETKTSTSTFGSTSNSTNKSEEVEKKKRLVACCVLRPLSTQALSVPLTLNTPSTSSFSSSTASTTTTSNDNSLLDAGAVVAAASSVFDPAMDDPAVAALLQEGLKLSCEALLPRHMVPSLFVFLSPSLPKTSTGKVFRIVICMEWMA
jgi:acyl-CoA synthetase (AMP-forming)/AMP-acid ligase II